MNMRGRGTSMSSTTNWFVVSMHVSMQTFSILIVIQNFWFALYIPTTMNKIRQAGTHSYNLINCLYQQLETLPGIHGTLLFDGDCDLLDVSCKPFYLCYLILVLNLIWTRESAGKTFEEMDFLFAKSLTPWVFKDREATKVGAIFERDLSRGEA